MRELLGGKGANLAEMTKLGFPVPRGFTVSTEACTRFYDDGKKIGDDIVAEIKDKLATLEKESGKKFGDVKNPLLVSVRSGSRASMPGMMDTILNLGLNDTVVEGLAALTGNPRFAYDSYRRFIQMFSDVVMELSKSRFERIIDEVKKEKGVTLDTELSADDLKELVAKFKAMYKEKMGADFPTEPAEQLFHAVKAVFRSWDNPRAIVYRRMHNIPYSWGTAVNVQEMVFGNMGDTSGTGVAFTRNPSTGEKKLYGEFLVNAQGEDVVAGIRTPKPISELEQVMPEVYKQFTDIATKLENHYRDMQDMEFTIENGKLFMLQTRNGKRTASAAIKIACDLVREGMIDKNKALLYVDPQQLDALLHATFDPAALKATKPVANGLPASPGAASGKVCFTPEKAVEEYGKGNPTILVRLETSPEDIEGMNAAEGILTARGGMTSHAAVVARGMGKSCVVGCKDMNLNEEDDFFTIAGITVKEGDIISIDGSTGNVYNCKLDTVEATLSDDFNEFMSWADAVRTLKVRTNADTPKDAQAAVHFGAEGIGLCRTEHMFFHADRIVSFREMIIANTLAEREAALAKLEPMQREDFIGIFEAMQGRPVTIRLLDPPLHEFLPHGEEDIKAFADLIGQDYAEVAEKIEFRRELNPMLGHRGCRLAVTYPELAAMQTKAIIEAALHVNAKGMSVVPEIMIPLIVDEAELKCVKDVVVETADAVIKESGKQLQYLVGTMIEIPRAALTADKIANQADFFSFGTNDLTQMTYGLSRDDASKFLDVYYQKKIFANDPAAHLDVTGVGRLIETAVKLGKQTKPDIKLGVCGEHGGDPISVEFFHNVGVQYVSCSPYRVPIARLAAAQAVLKAANK